MLVHDFKKLLPENEWLECKFVGWSTSLLFKSVGKVFLQFEVISLGAQFQTRLFRAFRVRKVVTTGHGGRFELSATNDLYKLLVRLLDVRLRSDRITLRPLRSMVFRVRCRTVRTDYAHKALPEHLQYTVIDEIERA